MIVHICSQADWEAAKSAGVYEADSLSTQGFIHCSQAEQVVAVANCLFKSKTDLILLLIDEAKVGVEIKYEDAGSGELFPHIFGPLPIEAVVGVREFRPQADGTFVLPDLT